jgi:hypothetical protein
VVSAVTLVMVVIFVMVGNQQGRQRFFDDMVVIAILFETVDIVSMVLWYQWSP